MLVRRPRRRAKIIPALSQRVVDIDPVLAQCWASVVDTSRHPVLNSPVTGAVTRGGSGVTWTTAVHKKARL